MISSQELVSELLSKPDVKLVIDQVSEELAKEQQKRHEFYEWLDEDKKAEFVNGEIILHSPVMKRHNDSVKALLKLLDTYVLVHKLGHVGVEKTLVALSRNDYEPDLCFFKKEKAKNFKKNQHIFPVPDFVVEVWSDSTKDYDETTKFEDYQKHSVEEYWMIDADKEIVMQYQLMNEKYELILKSGEGKITSKAVEGFSIPIRAIFDNELHLETLFSFKK